MEAERKRIVYDNIKVGGRGLTIVIVLGLLLMGILMAYGYYTGSIVNIEDVAAPVNGEALIDRSSRPYNITWGQNEIKNPNIYFY